jgi:hypothetical protein
MPTPSLPRRVAALSALTLAGTALLGGPAVAAPGDNGDVKIHVVGTAAAAHLKQPKVCRFYLDAFNFDVARGIHWTIEPQPARVGGTTLSGALRLTAGVGTTAVLLLPDGQYKLTWTVDGGNGAGKYKVFKVDCPNTPSGGPSGAPGVPRDGGHRGPNGGPPAGGGGLARSEAFTPVAGAATVGLAAVGGAVWFRLRRRPHGAA